MPFEVFINRVIKKAISTEVLFYYLPLFVVAFLLRFHGLDDESLWLDEVLSFESAGKLASIQLKHHILFTSWDEPHPPFYFILLRFWTGMFGTSAWALRSLSALTGSFLVVIVYGMGKNLISRNVGIISALLLLVNPVALYYSQEGRMYSLIPLIMLLATGSFFRMMNSQEGGVSFVLHILASIFLLYTDYLGVLLFLPFWGYVLVCHGLPGNWKKVVLYGTSNVVVFFLYVPWLAVALDSINFRKISWMLPPGLNDLANVLGTLLSGLQVDVSSQMVISDIGNGPGARAVFGLIGLYGLFMIGVGMYRALERKGSFPFLLALLSFVPVLIFLISVMKTPIFNLRQVQLYLPVFLFLLAYGMTACSSFVTKGRSETFQRGLLAVLILPIIVSNLFGCYQVYSVATKEDWRTVADELGKKDPALPVFVWKYYARKPFDYYYRGKAEVSGLDEKGITALGRICMTDKCFLIISHGSVRKAIASVERDFVVADVTRYRGIIVIALQKK